MRKMFKGVFATVLIMLCLLLPEAAWAENSDEAGADAHAKRTILLYVCGTNLETNNAMASYNLRQILQAKFSDDDDINVIVMTGGANRWHLESDYLAFPDTVTVPPDAVADDDGNPIDPKSQISNTYNQIWEARGTDAKINDEADPNAGKLVLLDGDGITKENESVRSEDEPVIKPDTLKTFINYGVTNYPADKYDLILWDHGGGSTGGFGGDDHDMYKTMPFSEIVEALSDNDVVDTNDDNKPDSKFDFIDFDACLMSTIELQLVMADYTDYYIASAETEPGYGQYYTGWLNTVGAEPEKNAFDLGRQMVDEYKYFYEKGPGKGEAGTLAVVNSKEFLNSGITGPLSQMTTLLNSQAEAGLFYDEILSVNDSIGYEYMNFFDLGNFASLVSIASSEQEDGEINPDNDYAKAGITEKIRSVLQDTDIIYARGTEGMQSAGQIYRDSDGTIKGGKQPTSGISFYFIDAGNQNSIESYLVYYDEMGEVAEMLPNKNDGRYQFLNAYRKAMMDYALLTVTGNAVNRILAQGTDKTAIDYDAVKDYLGGNETDPAVSKYTEWTRVMLQLLGKCGDEPAQGEAAKKEWLNKTIQQQAAEAVDAKNVTANKVRQKKGTGYKVHISETRNRIIDQVERKITLEIPAAKTYIEKNELYVDAQLPYGSVDGSLDGSSALSPDADLSDIIRWYTGTESEWILDAPEEKWYAIKDADGKLHAAAIVAEDEASFSVAAKIEDEDTERHMLLKFSKGDGENVLTEITDVTDSEGNRPVKPTELTQPISLMPSLLISGRSGGAIVKLYIPTSENEFTLSAEKADQISLVYTDISKITDIRDTDDDGTAFHSSFSIRDIYGGVTNISDAVNKAEGELIDIELANVSPAVYTGNKQSPKVSFQGKTLRNGTDYTWELIGAEGTTLSKVGDYSLLLIGKGGFTGAELKTIRILPKKAAIAKVKAGKKKLTVKARVKASKTGGTGYQVQYRLKGKSKWKTLTTKKQTVTIKKLKKGKKYKVRIRAFKKIGNKTYYGAWSKPSKFRKVR